jgi:hypothetical protein
MFAACSGTLTPNLERIINFVFDAEPIRFGAPWPGAALDFESGERYGRSFAFGIESGVKPPPSISVTNNRTRKSHQMN